MAREQSGNLQKQQWKYSQNVPSCLDRALPAVVASRSHCSLARTDRSTREDGLGPYPTAQNCQTILCSWWCSWQLQSARWPRKPFQPVRTEAAVGACISMYSLVTIWKFEWKTCIPKSREGRDWFVGWSGRSYSWKSPVSARTQTRHRYATVNKDVLKARRETVLVLALRKS